MDKSILHNKILHIGLVVMLMAAVMLSLSSCKGMELENKTEMIEEYTKPQAMVFIANERNRYEQAYSDKVWSLKEGSDGTSFDKLTVKNVMDFMEEIKLLNLLANERGIYTSSTERDRIRRATDAYMAGLTREDLAYIGCSRDDVQLLYTDYLTAEKVLYSITANTDTEISDSEVKVIKIAELGTTDLKKAKAILKRIKIDGESFASMASRYNELPVSEVTLMRGESDNLIEQTAFSMDEGQVSNILAVGDMYYIISCIDSYAEDETATRKDKLSKAIHAEAVRAVLDPYREEHKIQFRNSFWDEIDFSEPSGSTVVNFFEVYNETE